MDLHEAAKHFRWDSAHDYSSHRIKDGRIVALYWLGLYAEDLERLREMVPNLHVLARLRVEHDHGDWLRVDVMEDA